MLSNTSGEFSLSVSTAPEWIYALSQPAWHLGEKCGVRTATTALALPRGLLQSLSKNTTCPLAHPQ